MPELPEIVAFVAQCKGQFDEPTIRERLKSDGCTPDQIEEAFKSVSMREEMETDSMSGAVKTIIFVLAAGALGIFAALKYAPGVGKDDTIPSLSMQAGNVNLESKPPLPAASRVPRPAAVAESPAAPAPSGGSSRFRGKRGFSVACPQGFAFADTAAMAREAPDQVRLLEKAGAETVLFYPESLKGASLTEKMASPEAVILEALEKGSRPLLEYKNTSQRGIEAGLKQGGAGRVMDHSGARPGYETEISKPISLFVVFVEGKDSYFRFTGKKDTPALRALLAGLSEN